MMRQRAMERKNEEMEVMEVEEEGKSGGESESESEYEEYTDSEDEAEPRLKPVFIRKYDFRIFWHLLKMTFSTGTCRLLGSSVFYKYRNMEIKPKRSKPMLKLSQYHNKCHLMCAY